MREIRGHHLFCMTLFSGHGYDQEFTENMAGLIDSLREGEHFCLCLGPDAVCRACPHRQPDGGCQLAGSDVLDQDQAAREILGLQPGQELCWTKVKDKLAAVTQEEFGRVCGDCRWKEEGLCSYALLRQRTGQNEGAMP